jgi:hypothetical protein
MAGWTAVAIAKLGQRAVAFDPRIDARAADVVRSVTVQRLVVVAQREQKMCVTARAWRPRTTHEMPRVIGQPLVEVLLAEAGQHER